MTRSDFNCSSTPESWPTADDGARYLVQIAAELIQSDRPGRLSDATTVERLGPMVAAVAEHADASLQHDPRALLQRANWIVGHAQCEQVSEHAARAVAVAVFLDSAAQESSPLLERLRLLAARSKRFYNKHDILGIVHRRLGTAALTDFFVPAHDGVRLAEPVAWVVQDFETFLGRVGPDEGLPIDVDPEIVNRATSWLRLEVRRQYQQHVAVEAHAAAVAHLCKVLRDGKRPSDPMALPAWCRRVLINAASREARKWWGKPWEPLGPIDPEAEPHGWSAELGGINLEAALGFCSDEILGATRGGTRRRIARLVIEATPDQHTAARQLLRELIQDGALDRDQRGDRVAFLAVAAVLSTVDPTQFWISDAKPDVGVWRTVRRWVVQQLLPGLRHALDGAVNGIDPDDDDDDPDDGVAALVA